MRRKMLYMAAILLFGCVLMLSSCTEEHVHHFGDWIVTRDATCSTAGVKERRCDCGATEFQDIAATGGCVFDTQNVCTVCHVPQNPSVGLDYIEDGNGGYIVTGLGQVSTPHVEIPHYHLGKPVTEVAASAFRQNEGIVSLSVPYTVEKVGDNAFSNCINLKSVRLPDTLTYIGRQAFYKCSNLQQITIPAGVTSLADSIFNGCTALRTVEFGVGSALDEIGAFAFFGCVDLQNITLPATLKKIGSSAFYECETPKDVHISGIDAWFELEFFDANSNPLYYGGDLYVNGKPVTTMELPSYIDCVKDYTFNGWSGLETLVIPAHITSIGKQAFSRCTKLSQIVWQGESTLTTLGASAFEACTSLTAVTLPRSLVNLGEKVLGGCSKLETIAVEAGNPKYQSVGNCLVRIEDATLVLGTTSSVIPNDGSVQHIADYAFWENDKLIEIQIPSCVQSIGNGAFEGCSKLRRVFFDLNGQLRTIGESAFSGCLSLKEIALPVGVTTLGGLAFNDCRKMTKFTIADNSQLELIGRYAFRNCLALEEMSFGQNSKLRIIEDLVFLNCINLPALTIPETVTQIGMRAFDGCEELERVIFESAADWECTEKNSELAGIPVSVENPAENANYLTTVYKGYVWTRK